MIWVHTRIYSAARPFRQFTGVERGHFLSLAMLSTGTKAPSFSLINHEGETVHVRPGETGLPLALLFYPESGSMGCTRQACQFRDAIAGKEEFKAEKITIIGISPDSVKKQEQFWQKQNLNFPILSDGKREAANAYNVGTGMLGLVSYARTTFIIDKRGVVRDSLEATMNYGAHAIFIDKWAKLLQKEDEKA
ncbi:Thioredoxin-like fold [Amanita muscaria]